MSSDCHLKTTSNRKIFSFFDSAYSPAYSIAKKASALNIAVLFELITFLYTVNTAAIACRIYT